MTNKGSTEKLNEGRDKLSLGYQNVMRYKLDNGFSIDGHSVSMLIISLIALLLIKKKLFYF